MKHLFAICFLTLVSKGEEAENSDDLKGKIVEIPTLGRPAMLGELYSAHTDLFIPGFSLWPSKEIEKEKRVIWNPSSYTEFSADTSSDQKHEKLKVTASLTASFEAGMITVTGSAKYLDESEDDDETSTVTLSFHSISRTETLSESLTNTPLKKDCNLKRFTDKNSAPTHIVASVTYGGDCNFVFRKTLNDKEDKKAISGALKVFIQGGTWSINAQASLGIKNSDNKLTENLSLKMYSDFLLSKQPLTFNETLKIYQDISTNFGTKDSLYNQSVPMRVQLIPIKTYCRDGGLAAEIGKDILKRATGILVTLRKVLNKIGKLLISRSAEGNFEVRELLLGFLSLISTYTLDYEFRLQKSIIGARNPNNTATTEESLHDLIVNDTNSPFNYDKHLFTYLSERTRQVNALNIFYDQTVLQNYPQIAVYTKADIPRALITEPVLFLLNLYVLPNVSEYNYIGWTKKDEKAIGHWYNNFTTVGDIGMIWRDFRTFFHLNGYEEGLNFYVLLEPEKSQENEENMPMKLQLFIDGIETQKKFELETLLKLSTNPQVCRKGKEITITVDNPQNITGIKNPSTITGIMVSINDIPSVYRVPIDQNSLHTTLTISNVVPEYTYALTVSFITKYGSLTPSNVITKIGEFEQMQKTVGCQIASNSTKKDITENNLKFKNGTSAFECASLCHGDSSCSYGWTFQLATGNCYFNEKGTNKTEKNGWAVGTQSCQIGNIVEDASCEGPTTLPIFTMVTSAGPVWRKVYALNTAGGLFANLDETKKKNVDDPEADLFSILYDLGSMRNKDRVFHFKLCYPELTQYDFPCNEWNQTSNPVTESTITGFVGITLTFPTALYGSFQGLGLSPASFITNLIDNTPELDKWWYSIGSLKYFESDTVPGPLKPGPDGILVKMVELSVFYTPSG